MSAPASPVTVVATALGLFAGFAAVYRVMGRGNVDVLQLVPAMVVGGLLGHAVGEAWSPTLSPITATSSPTP